MTLLRYDTRYYFNVRSKADISQLNLPHALTLAINARCREDGSYDEIITQLTLSLYLMTQCQLKLRHSVTSLAQTLDDIAVAWRRQNVQWTLNQLTLKLCERKLITVISQLEANCCQTML